jgi:PAS domain-containing protein
MIMVVSSVALLFASLAFITFQWFSFRQRMVSDLSTLADMLADNVTAAISFIDHKDAEKVLNSLRAKPSIVFARIDLENGPVFAQYKSDRDVFVFDEKLPRVDSYRFVKDRLVMSRKIMLDDQRLGTLYLQSDLRELSVFIDKSIITLILLILLISVAAFLLASRLQRVISGPLFHLADVSRVVSQDEDYSVRAVKTSSDEIGILTEAFNNMMSQIERRELDRQRDEEELGRLRNLLSNIINSMPSILVGVDTQGRVTHWNRQAEQMTGIEAVNARGSFLKEVFPQLSGTQTPER